jgi:hypothetical protein
MESKQQELIPNLEGDEYPEYNDIPVHYCTECLSLKVRVYTEDSHYCDDCGSTEIKTTHITEWEKMYEDKYKINFLKKTNKNK